MTAGKFDVGPGHFIFCCFVLRQGLSMYPRLASNSQPSCFSLASAGVTGVCHHVLFSPGHFEERCLW
jgi:hypothetical protein